MLELAVREGDSLDALLRKPSLDLVDARILVMFALNITRVQLITQADRQLTAEEAHKIHDLFARRIQGEPVAYITGKQAFYSLDFCVTPDVLIPRPETELLVELACEYLPQQGQLLDMGTGSGAIAVSIAHERHDVEVIALDVSASALAIAQRNGDTLLNSRSTPVRFIQSDWYDALAEKSIFSVIVSNPPYIEKNDAHLAQGDLRFEPRSALTDHDDGLSDLRTIIAGAKNHLDKSGYLFVEHGYDQATAVRTLFEESGFQDVKSWLDLAGIERVSSGRA